MFRLIKQIFCTHDFFLEKRFMNLLVFKCKKCDKSKFIEKDN